MTCYSLWVILTPASAVCSVACLLYSTVQCYLRPQYRQVPWINFHFLCLFIWVYLISVYTDPLQNAKGMIQKKDQPKSGHTLTYYYMSMDHTFDNEKALLILSVVMSCLTAAQLVKQCLRCSCYSLLVTSVWYWCADCMAVFIYFII